MATRTKQDHYGIDLGTSNCLIAKIRKKYDGTYNVECLSDDDGNESFPSIVYYENERCYKVGSKAEKHLYSDPDNTIELIKIRLGKTNDININADGNNFTKSPQEVSACLLKHFKTLHGEDVDNVVVTVPAFFDQNQKSATMQAGAIAKVEVKSLIEEPTAAIMYHIFAEYKSKGINFLDRNQKNVLVFDFGGGTLDLSLIELTKKDDEISPQVLAIGGDEELGGNKIDFLFTKVLLEQFVRKHKTDKTLAEMLKVYEEYYKSYMFDRVLRFPDGTPDRIKEAIFRLKRYAERIKIQLSTDIEASVRAPGHSDDNLKISRAAFEKLILKNEDINIKERIMDALEEVAEKTRQKDAGIHEVLLVGGSSQIPYVKEIILEALQDMSLKREHIVMSTDFELAVAKGAAIQSALLAGVAVPPFMYNKCESVVARDIELEYAGGTKIFIEKGTTYPLKEKVTHTFEIGHSLSETVMLKLNELVSLNNKVNKRQICNFKFYLPIYYTNDQIKISMDIDEAGLYKIEAQHILTDEVVEFEPNKQFTLSTNDLKNAIEEGNKMRDIS